jgi:hypothetical protein
MALMLKIRIPKLKVLFVAESSMQMAGQRTHGIVDAIAPGERCFLRKPFTGHELLGKVDELLAGNLEETDRTAGAA